MKRQLTRQKIARYRSFIRRRNALRAILHRGLFHIKSFDQLFVIVIAIIIGMAAGFISGGFRTLILGFQQGLWGQGTLLDVVQSSPLYMKILVPVGGMMIVAWFVQRFAPEAKGHGVPEVMDAVARKNGLIRARVVLIKALASAFSIASGAAVGREGPIVQIGSAFGSMMGQFFKVSRRRMRTFVGCGAAAGISATFNAPIAGAIFACEILLGDFSAASIGPVIIASVFGTVISRWMYGDFPAFIPPEYQLVSGFEIIFYIILGVVIGVAGWLFVRTLYGMEDLADRLKTPVVVKAACGGLLIALFAIFLPQVLGVGYETMDQVLAGQLTLGVAAGLLLAKILATSISLSAGASGGVFAPSLFMGSMLGGTVGILLNSWFPTLTAPSGAYALVAMAAMVSATTHAPITAILIIFELTGEYTVILPLMISSIIAMVVSSRFLDGNIYTMKLKRRGIDLSGGRDMNILNKLNVCDLKVQTVSVVSEKMSFLELLDLMGQSRENSFYVCNDDGMVVGIVTHGMVRRFINHLEELSADALVSDFYNPHFQKITEHSPIPEVLQHMLDDDLLALPILDDTGAISGQILRRDILRGYQEMMIQMQSATHLASGMKYVHQMHSERIEVIPGYLIARIQTPSNFVNMDLKSIQRRRQGKVDILLIENPDKPERSHLKPSPDTRFQDGDELLIFGSKADVDSWCNRQ